MCRWRRSRLLVFPCQCSKISPHPSPPGQAAWTGTALSLLLMGSSGRPGVSFTPEVTRLEVRPEEPPEQLPVNNCTCGVLLHEAPPRPPCADSQPLVLMCCVKSDTRELQAPLSAVREMTPRPAEPVRAPSSGPPPRLGPRILGTHGKGFRRGKRGSLLQGMFLPQLARSRGRAVGAVESRGWRDR